MRYRVNQTTGELTPLDSGGTADDNFVGTLEEWNALTPAEQAKYRTRDITDDFNGLPIDSELSLVSENPVQNKVIASAINALTQALNDLVPLELQTGNISALPITINNAAITSDMEIIQYYVTSNSAYVNIDSSGITISNGSITLNGTISGTTNIYIMLQKVRTV